MNSSELEAKVKRKLFELHVCCRLKPGYSRVRIFSIPVASGKRLLELQVSAQYATVLDSLTLTTTPLALTWPFIFWLLSGDSKDTSSQSSASPAYSDDGHADCQLFRQLLLLKLIEIGHFESS